MARQPALQTPRGVIRPACCRTDEWGVPQSPHRLDERHIGLRFGDRKPVNGEWHVLLDGNDVTNECVEAYAGEDGWVIVYDHDGVTGKRYICPVNRSRDHALTVKKFGRVDVVRVPYS